MSIKGDNKHAYWQEIMRKYEASGISQTEFCKANKLSYPKFKYYRCRLRQQKKSESQTEHFSTIVPVRVAEAPMIKETHDETSCDIYFPNGLHLMLPQNSLNKATTRFIKELLA